MHSGTQVFAPDTFSLFIMRGNQLEQMVKLPMYVGFQHPNGSREVANIATELPEFFGNQMPAGIFSYAKTWLEGKAIPVDCGAAYAYLEPFKAVIPMNTIEKYLQDLIKQSEQRVSQMEAEMAVADQNLIAGHIILTETELVQIPTDIKMTDDGWFADFESMIHGDRKPKLELVVNR